MEKVELAEEKQDGGSGAINVKLTAKEARSTFGPLQKNVKS